MHSYYGILPIHLAICNNYLDIVKLLVEKGSSADARNKVILIFYFHLYFFSFTLFTNIF